MSYVNTPKFLVLCCFTAGALGGQVVNDSGRHGRLINTCCLSKTARNVRRAPTDCHGFQRAICISVIQ